MVKNVYNYRVNPDNYDAPNLIGINIMALMEDGAMLVGWNYKKVDKSWK